MGAGDWGRGPRPTRKGPRVSEHEEVLRGPHPHPLLRSADPHTLKAPSAGWGSRGQKEDKEGPLTPALVMGPRSPSAIAEIETAYRTAGLTHQCSLIWLLTLGKC